MLKHQACREDEAKEGRLVSQEHILVAVAVHLEEKLAVAT